ncbi:MAG: hypothetical protein IJU07_01745 [Synergistaceae bacterium]|nr:hypothetical protein [Synergistaceae bacterium]
MKCKACGAPLEVNDEKCKYCGTITPYGEEKFRERETLKQESERRKEIENLPQMKYVSLGFLVTAYIFTAGLYSVYWYAIRMKPLNSLDTQTKLPAWLTGIFALLSVVFFMVQPDTITEYGLSEENAETVFNVLLSLVILVSVWAAFTVKKILQEYASNFVGKNTAVQIVAASNVLLILFGAAYLQSEVNKMIKLNMFAPKI